MPIDRAFDHEQRRQLPARHAEHTQQRELRAPAHDRQRLRREDQQAAGEQRHQREDVQIDAVGARQACAGRDARLGALRPRGRRAGCA